MTVPLLNGTGERVLNTVTEASEGNLVATTGYTYRLMRTSGTPGQVATFNSAQRDTHFDQVPGGTYELKVTAFRGVQNVTLGGEGTSVNTVTVGARQRYRFNRRRVCPGRRCLDQ